MHGSHSGSEKVASGSPLPHNSWDLGPRQLLSGDNLASKQSKGTKETKGPSEWLHDVG